MSEFVKCPFCREPDFDLEGLKHHLSGWCEAYLRTPTLTRNVRYKNVSCSQCGGEFGEGNHGFSHCEHHEGAKTHNGPERVFISEHEYEVDVPDDFDPLPQVVAGLRERKQKILADSQLAANEIDDQIQRLLCIENKS